MARTAAKLWQNAFQAIPRISFFDAQKIFGAKFSDQKIGFSLISQDIGGVTAKWNFPSTSTSNFALEPPILLSVRPKIIEKMSELD